MTQNLRFIRSLSMISVLLNVVIILLHIFLLIPSAQGFVREYSKMSRHLTNKNNPCYFASPNVFLDDTQFVLSNGGVEVHFDICHGALVLRYWGGTTHGSSPVNDYFSKAIPYSDFDHRLHPGIMREHSRGWLGHPSLLGHRRQGVDWSTMFYVQQAFLSSQDSNEIFEATLRDEETSLLLYLSYVLDPFGVLRISYRLQNIHKDEEYYLQELSCWLPLPDQVSETLDFHGRWSRERNPQWRKQIHVGRWVRESWEGRPGHSFTIGTLAMTPGTCFGHGHAWAVACAYSGNSRNIIEKTYDGMQSMGVEEILFPGEVILKPNESYEAPQVLAVYSSQGLDGSAQAFHQHVRARTKFPQENKSRPMTLNLWEAIYFQHDPDRVMTLVKKASDIGVERIVLDDGWFSSRRNDTAGLGDWTISEQVWPNGTLDTVAKYIRDQGMQMGLWFEGEMVNVDSHLYQKHPDWIMDEKGRIVENKGTSVSWRHQYVLNLAHPDAFHYLLESISFVISRLGVSYIKWDHNRALVNAGYVGRPTIRKQTLALYKFLSELRQRHPLLEIESCASGGARIDFGILDHVHRFWTSDCNDALERQMIQRWTMQFIPPEFLGCHIGPSPSHQTRRTLSLPFRTTTALFGHAGIECDLTQYSREDLEAVKRWISYYKTRRDLLHSGTMVRMDYIDDSMHLYGVIDRRKEHALFTLVALTTLSYSQPPNLRFRGLINERVYNVQVVYPVGQPSVMQVAPPEWIVKGSIQATGSWLEQSGLPAPILCPAEALLIELTII